MLLVNKETRKKIRTIAKRMSKIGLGDVSIIYGDILKQYVDIKLEKLKKTV